MNSISPLISDFEKLESLSVINFFKIRLILNSVSSVLRVLFKDKWLEQAKIEWKIELGYVLVKNLKKLKLDETTVSTIKSGNLNSWDLNLLLIILINYPFKNQKDHEILLKINEMNKKFIQIENEDKEIDELYKINENDYNEIRSTILNQCLIEREKGGILNLSEKECREFKKEIENRIDIIPSREVVRERSIGGESDEELEANRLIECGDIEFEKGNYQRSIDYYNDALLFNGFNDIKRSMILSKVSMINLRFYQYMMIDGEYSYLFYIKKQQLEDSKNDAVLACTLCPLLNEGYYRGAQILCFLGNFEKALLFLNVSLSLDPDNKEVSMFKDQIVMKINSRCYTTTTSSAGEKKRDFQKEAEQFVEAHKYSDYYDGDDLQLSVYTKGIDEMAKTYHLPRQHFINIACSRVAGTYSKKKNYQLAYKYLSHGAGGDYALCAYRLGSIYERGLGGVEKNLDTALSLYYEASLKPFKFDIPHDIEGLTVENRNLMERNEGVIMANNILGHIFSKGIGAEIDMDQAIYYFQRSIDEANSTEALLSLAQIYFYGMNHQHQHGAKKVNQSLIDQDKKKAIELVKRGFDLGDRDCQREYYHFTGITPPNHLTGEGVNASFKTLIIIVSTLILFVTLFSKLLIDFFNKK